MSKHPIIALAEDYDVIDLSHSLREGIPYFPTHTPFSRRIVESYWAGDVAVAYEMTFNEHNGTHVDSPAHFIRDGEAQHVWIDGVDPLSLFGRGVVLDVTSYGERGEIGVEALDAFEVANGGQSVGAGDLVILNTGWNHRWEDREAYVRDWPGINLALAQELTARGVKAVGIDSIGFDLFGDLSYPAHYELLGHGILILENIANVDALPPVFHVAAIPLKIWEGSASPIRLLAFVPKNGR